MMQLVHGHGQQQGELHVPGLDAAATATAVSRQQQQQQHSTMAAGAVRMAPDSVTARRMSLAALAGPAAGNPATTAIAGRAGHQTAATATSTPFTQQQQQALMRLAGGPLAQQHYAPSMQQYQHAMMLQRHNASMAQFGRPHAYLQAQHRGETQMVAYPAAYHAPASAAPSSAALAMHSHHHYASIEAAMHMQLQQQQQRKQQLHPHQIFSYPHHPANAGPPSAANLSTSHLQYHFVGGEPTSGYRLVTPAQLHTAIPPPPALTATTSTSVQPADLVARAGIQEAGTSSGHNQFKPTAVVGDQHDQRRDEPSTTIKMQTSGESNAEQQQQGNTGSSMDHLKSSSDTNSPRSHPTRHAALAAGGAEPNTSSPRPNASLSFSSTTSDGPAQPVDTTSRTPPLAYAGQSQQGVGASSGGSILSDRKQDAATSVDTVNSGPNSAASSTPSVITHSSTSVTPQPVARSNLPPSASSSSSFSRQHHPNQLSSASGSSSSTSASLSSPQKITASSSSMPRTSSRENAAHTSTSKQRVTKASQKQKQVRRPTLTVDTSIVAQSQAQAPMPVQAQVSAPAPALAPSPLPMLQPQNQDQVLQVLQLPPQVYQVATTMQHPSYAIEMHPEQVTMYTQASPPGYATLRTLQLNHALTNAFKKQEPGAVDQCITEFFHKDGKFKFSMSEEGKEEPSNEYLIPMCAIPRFYESMRRCGAQSIQLVLDDPQEWILGADSGTVMTDDGTSGYMVESRNATLIVSYSSGSTVFSRGSCRALYRYQQADPLFDKQGRLLSSYPQMSLLLSQLEYDFVDHTEMVNRSAIKTRAVSGTPTSSITNIEQSSDRSTDHANEEAARPAKRPKLESQSMSQDASSHSQPNARATRIRNNTQDTSNWQECSIPGPPVRNTGLSDESMRVLEIGEAVDHLGELICFSLANNLSPLEALEHYATLSVKAGFVPDPRLGEAGEFPGNAHDLDPNARQNFSGVAA